MEKISPFDIPLLNNEICQYLRSKDLACCVQVSKAWAVWFTPALWRDVDWFNRTPTIPAFTRQQEHVRVVRNITMKRTIPLLAPLSCTNLQRLDFVDYTVKVDSDICGDHLLVLPALERISTLRHLQIPLALSNDNICQQWIRVLEALPHLESLSLKCEELVKGWIIPRVLHLCRGLQCLSVRFMEHRHSIQEKDWREYWDVKAAIETMPEMQLRELSFGQSKLWGKNIIQPLLERCPRLEKLNLSWTHDEALFQHLVKTLKENKLPALRHLSMGMPNRDDLDNLLIEVLSHISCGLESFDCESDAFSHVTQPLIKHHSHSLTNLALHHSWIHFGTFLDLMVGLPCLQTFTVSIHGAPNGNNDILLDKHWECLGMRSLQLQLEKRALDYVFSEVAKLTSLRELRIRSYSMDLYNKNKGYLEQLAGLKQLEVLGLTNTRHDTLGRHEAQWMADNWPRLRQVYEYHVPAVFKETLRKRRPLVEFVKMPSNY